MSKAARAQSSLHVSPEHDGDISGIIHNIVNISVSAYASSVGIFDDKTLFAENVINVSSPYVWHSNSAQNQWIVINFTENEIYSTHYSIQTREGDPFHNHPKMWKVEGFNKGQWLLIDEVTSSNINYHLAIETRPLASTGPFSAFKFTSTGPNWLGAYVQY